MKYKFGKLLALSLAVTMAVAPVNIGAQADDPGNKIIPSLELDQADVRDALKILFNASGISYTVASDVQGVVTVNLKNIPFRTALRNVLNQVDSTWREEGGVYNIIRKPQITDTGDTTDPLAGQTQVNPIRKIKIMHADPALIIRILSGEGDVTLPPETSAYSGVGGGQGGFGGGFGGGQGGFSGGFGGGGFSGGGGFGGGGFSGGGGFGGGGFGGGGFGGGGFGGGGFGGGGRR